MFQQINLLKNTRTINILYAIILHTILFKKNLTINGWK
jgi:hypothetical protein